LRVLFHNKNAQIWRGMVVSSVYIRICDSKRILPARGTSPARRTRLWAGGLWVGGLLRQLDRNEIANKAKEEVRAVTLREKVFG